MTFRDRLHAVRYTSRRLLWLAALTLLLVWCVGAIWFSGQGPAAARIAAAAAFALFWPVWLLRGGDVRAIAATFVVAGIGSMLIWQLKRPSTDRDWVAEQVVAPNVTFEHDTVRIEGFRACRYRSTTDMDVAFETQTFDLRELDGLDVIVERFAEFDGAGHVMLTFGFTDGRRLVVSVEIRREQGEEFGVVAGMFREYELFYVVGDERDLVQLRTTHRKSKMWLLPIRADLPAVRTLLVAMLTRADRLGREPEFYDTMQSTCASNVAHHLDQLLPGSMPIRWEIALPGYAGSMLHDLGLVADDAPWPEIEERRRIDLKAQAAGDGPEFSAVIRAP